MPDHAASAIHHLNEAARHTPGTQDERYHSQAAATYAYLDAAAAQREQALLGKQLVELQREFIAGLENATAATAPAPEPATS